MRYFIIGPGGVGKTTCGRLLAEKLNCDFIDLDHEFKKRINYIIEEHIHKFGKKDYHQKNSALFFKLLDEVSKEVVFVLSSGFLIKTHIEGLANRHLEALKKKGTIIRLLPSKDINESTKIVVTRQLERGYGLTKKREEVKFRERYPIYDKLGDIKIYSYKPPEEIVEEILSHISHIK